MKSLISQNGLQLAEGKREDNECPIPMTKLRWIADDSISCDDRSIMRQMHATQSDHTAGWGKARKRDFCPRFSGERKQTNRLHLSFYLSHSEGYSNQNPIIPNVEGRSAFAFPPFVYVRRPKKRKNPPTYFLFPDICFVCQKIVGTLLPHSLLGFSFLSSPRENI